MVVNQVFHMRKNFSENYLKFGLAPSKNIRQPSSRVEKFNPLNAERNPICHLLALLGAHPILHVSRIRVKEHRLEGAPHY
jgi:hypothetical protein